MYGRCLFHMNRANDNAYKYLPLLGPIDLPLNCRATILTHNWFLTRNICHTKCFSDSREKREMSREKRETRREVVTYFWAVLYANRANWPTGNSSGTTSPQFSRQLDPNIFVFDQEQARAMADHFASSVVSTRQTYSPPSCSFSRLKELGSIRTT